MPKESFPPREPIADPEAAVLFLYRRLGDIIGETYRSETPPFMCLEQVRLHANYGQAICRKLFHQLKGD